MFKQEPYPLSQAMMKIADNPSNPWLHDFLKANKLTVYKFSEPRPVGTKDKVKPVYPQFDAKDALIKHLAAQAKIDD